MKCGADFKPRVYFSSKDDEKFVLHYQALSKGTIIKSGRLDVKVEADTQDRADVMKGLIGSGANEHINLSPKEVRTFHPIIQSKLTVGLMPN